MNGETARYSHNTPLSSSPALTYTYIYYRVQSARPFYWYKLQCTVHGVTRSTSEYRYIIYRCFSVIKHVRYLCIYYGEWCTRAHTQISSARTRATRPKYSTDVAPPLPLSTRQVFIRHLGGLSRRRDPIPAFAMIDRRNIQHLQRRAERSLVIVYRSYTR